MAFTQESTPLKKYATEEQRKLAAVIRDMTAMAAYVDSQIGANNELNEILANGNTTGGTSISVTSGDDIILNNGGFTATLREPVLAGNIVLTYPTTTGTIALTTDISNIGTDDLTINTSGARKLIMGGALATDIFAIRDSADSNTIFYINGEGEVNANGGTGQASITSIGDGAYSQATRTTGVNNTAIGNGALRLATSGGENTAIGSQSMYDLTGGLNNTGVGYQSLANITASSSHTGVGYQALSNLGSTTGANNIGIGKQAGAYHTSGTTALTQATNSVFIGTVARASGNAVTNEIVIGVSALGNGSNTATIGTASTTNLYIGTTLNLYQETTAVGTTAFVANTSGIVDDSATFGGYKISQIVGALQAHGLLA